MVSVMSRDYAYPTINQPLRPTAAHIEMRVTFADGNVTDVGPVRNIATAH